MMKQKNEWKLSIIIPVYNTEKFIRECLDSCLNQDIPLDEYEIICVDDGSSDNSLNILYEYSKKYSNIYVITQENQGVSSARNAGIRVAQGKYIWFVDSDDYIASNCLKILLDAMSLYDAESCIFSHKTVIEKDSCTCKKERLKINSISILNKRRTSSVVWNMLFSRELLLSRNINFLNGQSYLEDAFFSYMYSLYSNKYKTLQIEGVLYYSRKRAGSAMRTKTIEATNKYVNSMKLGALKYQEHLEKNTIPKDMIKEVQNRVKLAVSAAMFRAAAEKKYDNINLIAELKTLGLYPYKLYWGSLKPNTNLKHTVIEWIKFLFPFESYYKLFTYIIRKIH